MYNLLKLDEEDNKSFEICNFHFQIETPIKDLILLQLDHDENKLIEIYNYNFVIEPPIKGII